MKVTALQISTGYKRWKKKKKEEEEKEKRKQKKRGEGSVVIEMTSCSRILEYASHGDL